MRAHIRTACVILAAVLLPALAAARGPEGEHRQGDVRFLTGGVGESRHEAILAAADAYDLWLTLTAPGGAYLADVRVRIEDADGGTVLDTPVDGPFLLAQLPPGRYRVHATSETRAPEVRDVDVPESGQARVFVAMTETSGA